MNTAVAPNSGPGVADEAESAGPGDARATSPGALNLLNEQGQRIQHLVEQLDRLTDPAARTLARDCIQAVLAFHGAGLERILDLVRQPGANSKNTCEVLAGDPAIRALLLIHGLHPVSLETRLREALDKVRPYMQSHGGNVELAEYQDGHARLRLVGACHSCASSAVTMELALRQAIEEFCPDLRGFEVEGGQPPAQPASSPPSAPERVKVAGALELRAGAFLATRAANVPLLICSAAGELFAYRDHCPACNAPLRLGTLEHDTFRCGSGHAYDVRQAGRSLGHPGLHLDPFPLLVEDGDVWVFVR